MLTRKRVLYFLAAVAIVIAGGSLLLPAQAVVSRSIIIEATPDEVFGIVGDLRRFREFWPKAGTDSDIRYSYQGTESGLGQKLVWISDNPEIGSGVETIVTYRPPELVQFRSVLAPRERAITGFELAPTETGTEVTWTLTADLASVPARWSGLLFDRRVGGDFEKGLARLKTLAETPHPDFPSTDRPN